MTEYYGKYRGKVESNLDPLQIGRVQVSVPAVLGEGRLSWAMPCMPFASNGSGVYVVPKKDSLVWVEFEGGDPDYPIYSGGFWSDVSQVPPEALAGVPLTPNIVLKTDRGHVLSLGDLPGVGGFTLRTAGGASITVNETGIVISNGKGATITMTGPTIDLNNGALTIT
jgi:hypothetical protein